MRTQRRPAGAARRATLAGIAAGLLIGLAACGNKVAGAGTAGTPGAASSQPIPTMIATPGPSEVNPLRPGALKHVALCRNLPGLTRMTFLLSNRPPSLRVREVLPRGFPVRNGATVRQLASLLCALPPLPAGQMMCPELVGGMYRLYFFTPRRAFPVVGIGLSGCRVVTGLGPPRSWASSARLKQALAQHFGIQFPPEGR
jgi:hypothetical protein